ncbi:hypothetical protein G6F65_019046 [Rhizopus arrhizus]|nr:hypothetical protein G6F65_019046 [Rhizopus arrhizus]
MRSQSLLSVIIGGVAFDTQEQRSHQAAAADASFVIYQNEEAARAQPDGVPLRIRMRFDQSVRGLVVGAPIDASSTRWRPPRCIPNAWAGRPSARSGNTPEATCSTPAANCWRR